jgi:hypothetical protein
MIRFNTDGDPKNTLDLFKTTLPRMLAAIYNLASSQKEERVQPAYHVPFLPLYAPARAKYAVGR